MKPKDFIKLVLLFLGGTVIGGALVFLILSFVTVAEAQEPTIEEQYEIQTQYLTATDAALEELNSCAAFYLMIPFMTEGKDPKATAIFESRSQALGHTIAVIVFHSEYYFPHIYAFDTNYEKIMKLSNTWSFQISQNPTRYMELARDWLEKCENIIQAKTYFAEWIKQYPVIQDDWPVYPGREKPPEDWASPSMKRIQEKMEGGN